MAKASRVWDAYVPTLVGERDRPRVVKHDKPSPWLYSTRAEAIHGLRLKLEREQRDAMDKVAELGRALANLREMEEEP